MRQIYVLTGASGTGKSTITRLLKQKGYSVVQEQARQIIAEESAKPNGISRLNPDFPVFLAKKQCEQEKLLDGISFVDRGIIDGIAYLKFEKKSIPHELEKMIKKVPYEKTVFFLELPPESTHGLNNHELSDKTYDSYENAKVFQRLLADIYQSLGYELCVVPFGSFDAQVNFIESRVNSLKWVFRKDKH